MGFLLGFLFSFLYGVVLAFANLSVGDWQFWALLVLYFAGRFLGYYEGTHA